MTLPDFIIIGAMKCGTTTLHAQLKAQDGFFMSYPKEPNFFSDDDVYAQGLDWYRGLFTAAPLGALKGEASTHYTKLPTHPETIKRLAAAAPDAKLIYMMRHPIDRLVSHYIHAWTWSEVKADINAAAAPNSIFVDYGRYAYQLAPYLEYFGKARVLPVFLERMNAHPDAEMKRIGRFLGHSAELGWRDDLGPRNVSSERIRRFPLYDLLIKSKPAQALRKTLAPKSLRNWVKEKLRMRDRPQLTAEKERELAALFDEDLAQLGALLGAELRCETFKDVVRDTPLDWVERR